MKTLTLFLALVLVLVVPASAYEFVCATVPGPVGSMTFVITGTAFSPHKHPNGTTTVMVETHSRASRLTPIIVVCSRAVEEHCSALAHGDFVTITGHIVPQECAEWIPIHKPTQQLRLRATNVFLHSPSPELHSLVTVPQG